MILKDVKDYVESRHQVSLGEIATHFDVEPEAVKGMLEFWVKKGRITHHSSAQVCGGGCSCSQKDISDIYEWNQQLGHIPIQIN